MTDIPLSRLTRDIVQNTYKEMHALLDSLGDLPEEHRQEKLIDFTLKMRHRFARLLVAVRWFMTYSAFHSSATATKQLASSRSLAFTTDADTLFTVSNIARGAAAQPSAVQQAAEVLGASAFFSRIPRIIETAVGLDLGADVNAIEDTDTDESSSENDVKDDKDAEAIERLAVATRYVIESALPNGVVVISTAAPPRDAAIRIGVPDAWTADLILDRLFLDDALVILLRFEILVSPHPDALGSFHNSRRDAEHPLPLRKDQSEPLRQMIEDRMRWVSVDSAASEKKKDRIKNVLMCLAKAMSFECAGKIAMDHVRDQALTLASHQAWKSAAIALSGVGSAAADDVPVLIRYWQSSYMKSALRIYLPKEEDIHTTEVNLVCVEHEPKLTAKGSPHSMSLNSLSVEAFLLETCRTRARNELQQLQAAWEAEFPAVTSRIVSNGLSSISLVVCFDGCTHGLNIGVSLRSGGYFIQPHGAVCLALNENDPSAEAVRRDIWQGDCFFPKGINAVKTASVDLIRKTAILLSRFSAVQCSYAIDAGSISSWPPGAASVQKPEDTLAKTKVTPPFMCVDRKRPRKFMTLNTIANADDEVYLEPSASASKRARTIPMHYSRSSEDDLFVEGRRPEGVELLQSQKNPYRINATSLADWAEVRHAAEIRLKRDSILKQFDNAKVATVKESDYSLRSSEYSLLDVKTEPLEVEKAALLFLGDDEWKIQLILTNNIFDAESSPGRVSYFSEKRLLTFSYPDISIATINAFGMDLSKARTSAALIQGLSKVSKHYSLLRKNPSFVQFKSHDITITVRMVGNDINVSLSPPNPLIQDCLIPLIEEVLKTAGKIMGVMLVELLELSLPIGLALQKVVPMNDPSYMVKFTTCLRARLTILQQPPRKSFALDIDARNGSYSVLLIDVGKALKLSKKTSGSHFSSIPSWDALVQKVVSRKCGKSVHSGAAMKLHISVVGQVILAIVHGVTQGSAVPTPAPAPDVAPSAN